MQKYSRTENSFRNISYSMMAYAIKFLASFFFRMVFVRALGNLYAGIDSVFSTILYLISLVELGYETAMAYLLYRPIAENNQLEISQIMRYYRKASHVIAGVICLLGLALVPFLSELISDLPYIPHIRLIFLAVVGNMALEYFFKYQRTLICAWQKQYVFTLAHYLAGAAMDLLQIAVVLFMRSYLLCLLMQAVGLIIEAGVERRYIRKHFGNIFFVTNEAKDKGFSIAKVGRQVSPYLYSVAFHKAGTVLLGHCDLLLVSQLSGVWQAGIYSNYKYILYALNSVFTLLMESVAAGVGELGARRDIERSKQVFGAVYLANAWLFSFSSVCLFVLFTPFITLCLGADSLFSGSVVAAIVLRFYVNGMKKAVTVYRDALGLFIHDRWVPVSEFILFICFSLGLSALGIGVESVLYGSVLAGICTSVWIEPLLLYQKGFAQSGLGRYFLMYVIYFVFTFFSCLFTAKIAWMVPIKGIPGLLWQIGVCVVVPNVFFFLCFSKTSSYKLLRSKIRRFLIKRKGEYNEKI